MKKMTLLAMATLLFVNGLLAAPLWMRYPAISPDGTEIAFSYKGDIYKVAVTGGDARQMTTHEAHDYMPVWSPDGRHIAFASDRYGNFDIYVMDAEGGAARRVTTHSGNEAPYTFTPDGKYIVFSAKMQAPAASAVFPTAVMTELYQIPVTGGRPELLLATPAEKVVFTGDGNQIIYQDKKGFEDRFRKHHTSAVTRNIWCYDRQTGRHQPLITDAGEDTDPVLSADDTTVFFLSERTGTYNVHRFDLRHPQQVTPVTAFDTHPVRFLSMAGTGTLCFFYNGEIYVKPVDGAPQKVDIRMVGDSQTNDLLTLNNTQAYGRAVSEDGKQVAVVMRGEIFVASAEYKYTKRITHTAAAEAAPDFSPDGKTLVYASERNGVWNIYTAQISRLEEPFFFNATLVAEAPLFPPSDTERTLPQFSPDGKEIAYVENRRRLMVYNLETKATRQITDGTGQLNTSGRVHYEWSPDSRWFTLTYTPNKHEPYTDIGLVSAGGGAVTNITRSGYANENPKWVLNGNALLFHTERYGMRNHASWGSLQDVMMVFMNQKACDQFTLTDDDYQLWKEEEKQSGKEENPAAKNEPRKDKSDEATNIIVELENMEDRIVRLTPNSADLGDAILTPDGEKLYYLASFEKGYDLWSINCRTRETKVEIKDAGNGALVLSKDGKELFLLGRNTQKITLAGNKKTPVPTQAEFTMDLENEREYMFHHVWTQEQKCFYTESMHGVDWDLMKAAYVRFLPHINNNYDFAELLSEMLGELNVSHTGGRYYPQPQHADQTAQLGLLFSWEHTGDGLLVDEVLEKGPFDNATTQVKAGDVVEKIDGVTILAAHDYYPLLNKKAGKKTLLSFYNPQSGRRWEEVVKPITIARQNGLLYERWVRQRAADVDRLSGGRLGYVHIQSMADPSFRSIYSDILGKFNTREGIVIDTRFNGGGRMHEDIEVLFSGKKYFTQVVRGMETCDMPSRRWNRPSVMIMGEANYSNAHGTPWVYKHTGIGKLVGMPVPGTMTSVSWETLQDNTLVFGIPIVGYQLPDGSYLENRQLEPDVKIANSPEKIIEGHDEQLAEAVRVLLEELPE